ncbi:MAG: sigma 54-interacting transcriptional regulator [Devosia sp.]
MVRVRHSGRLSLANMVAEDPAMHRILDLCRRAARGGFPALIEGEAGTGKARLARLLHDLSDRAAKPFVAFDCAATSWHEVEPALFGVRRMGAASTPGRLHEAQGGTLLIREVADLPPAAQERLLHFISAGEIATPGYRPERLDVRIIAGSSRRLLNATRAGEFDEQLFYRLNVLPITLPPLRDRPADIEPLVCNFLLAIARETGRPEARLAPQALDLLRRHAWPGNVRELENATYRATALAAGPLLEPQDFPHALTAVEGREVARRLTAEQAPLSAPVHIDRANSRRKQTEGPGVPDRFLTRDGEVTPLAQLERELIAFALRHYGARMARVARALGIGRSSLYRKVRELGLEGVVERDAA